MPAGLRGVMRAAYTSTSSRRCVKSWRMWPRRPRISSVGPGEPCLGFASVRTRLRWRNEIADCVSGGALVRPAASSSNVGQPHRPASRPVEGRRRSRYERPERRIAPTAWTMRCALRGVRMGSSFWRFVARAWHHFATGHWSHCGLRGVQIRAPSSMSDWLKSPACLRSRKRSASAHNSLCEVGALIGSSMRNRRARTRLMLPSTVAIGSLPAMLAMAAAV